MPTACRARPSSATSTTRARAPWPRPARSSSPATTLPARWRGREQFVVLETGFGLGNNFLATWQAWRDDPERSTRLHFLSIEARPLQRDDLAAEPRDEGLAPLAAQLAAAWPPLTCNLHRLSFEAGRVQLLLALGDVGDWLPQLVARVDAFFLDGFAPARNPGMWEPRLFKAMARIAAPDATAATWSVARPVRDGLAAAGFEVAVASGQRRQARDHRRPLRAPIHAARRARAKRLAIEAASAPSGARLPVAIVGGGLAGCAARRALAERGRASTLFERRSALAQEGSGNAAGVFHGVVHGHDGHHARFHRAAAFEAQRAVAEAIAGHGVRGSTCGAAAPGEPRHRGGAHSRPCSTGSACRRTTYAPCRRPKPRRSPASTSPPPAWHFVGGGWVEPRGLARAYAERAGERAGRPLRARGRRDPSRRRPLAAPRRDRRRARDRRGRRPGQRRRRPRPARRQPGPAVESRPDQRHRPAHAGRRPRRCACRSPARATCCPRSTARPGSAPARTKATPIRRCASDDHRANVERLAGLVAEPPALAALGELSRPRRLALGEPRPAAADRPGAAGGHRCRSWASRSTPRPSPRPEQPRFAPRAPGLFVFAGLGSRGIAGSALGAQVLAASITGAPLPLEADLLDAVDPARFASRAFRRAGLPPGAAG